MIGKGDDREMEKRGEEEWRRRRSRGAPSHGTQLLIEF